MTPTQYFNLLDITGDILRNCIFTPTVLDECSLGVCRFVCSRLRNMIVINHRTLALQNIAARLGYLNVLRWAYENKASLNEWTTSACAETGQLMILQWLRSKGVKWNTYTAAKSAENGHLPTLQWAVSNGAPANYYVFAGAIRAGHLHILEWAVNEIHWGNNVLEIAMNSGHSQIVEWARAHGGEEVINPPGQDPVEGPAVVEEIPN